MSTLALQKWLPCGAGRQRLVLSWCIIGTLWYGIILQTQPNPKILHMHSGVPLTDCLVPGSHRMMSVCLEPARLSFLFGASGHVDA